MAVRAHDVAAELRVRLPGVPIKKLHKLLYFCQGHHLAATGETLFAESVMAWDMGPVVAELWYAERQDQKPAAVQHLDEAQLNTIGYVVSRYGKLTGLDLEHLTHAQTPWNRANLGRPAGDSVRIEQEWMAEYFASATEELDTAPPPDRKRVAAWLAPARNRMSTPVHLDSRESLAARMRDASE